MFKKAFRIAAALLAVTAATATAPAAAQEPPDAGGKAGIRGKARMYFPAPGNSIWVTVNARSEFGISPGIPERSWGTFTGSSGGSPGLQAGEESGPRQGASRRSRDNPTQKHRRQ